MKISAIITAYNEGTEVADTIQSVRDNTGPCEVVVIDDGSTDGCCTTMLQDVPVDVFQKNDRREGVAPARIAGAKASSGDCLIFLDAHQRVSEGCLDRMADVALEHNAITSPCESSYALSKAPDKCHGAYISQSRDEKEKKGIIGIHWIYTRPRDPITRITGAYVPYCVPRSVYPIVRWSPSSFGYGGNEASLAVRAWFAEIDMLHTCGVWARHMFRKGKDVAWDRTMPQWFQSHALTCRVCFDEETWENYWWPKVFAGKVKYPEILTSEAVAAEHHAFKRYKTRTDEQFFRGLFQIDVPEGVRRDT